VSHPRELLLQGGGLRVRFWHREDRYAHEVDLAVGSKWVRVLTSVEGSSVETWPPSPAFQSVSLENQPGNRRLALMVGMSGASHYSASVVLDARAARVSFDVACRIHADQPGPLGSSYQASHPACNHPDGSVVIEPGMDPGVQLGIQLRDDLGRSRLDAAGGGVVIRAVVPAASAGATTIRWGYILTRLDQDSLAWSCGGEIR
jgi:hypothetical protein